MSANPEFKRFQPLPPLNQEERDAYASYIKSLEEQAQQAQPELPLNLSCTHQANQQANKLSIQCPNTELLWRIDRKLDSILSRLDRQTSGKG